MQEIKREFLNKNGGIVLHQMVTSILKKTAPLIMNRQPLMTMLLNFQKHGNATSLTEGLYALGTLFLNQGKGDWALFYGTIFLDMATGGERYPNISTKELRHMLFSALRGIKEIANTKTGGIRLIQLLIKAITSLEYALIEGLDFPSSLLYLKIQLGKCVLKEEAAYIEAASLCAILVGMIDGILDSVQKSSP